MSTTSTEQASVSHKSWLSLTKVMLLRIWFCYIILYFVPDLLRYLPGTVVVVSWVSHLFDRLICSMVGIQVPAYTGSGDTPLRYIYQATTLTVSFVTGIAWSLLDRRSDINEFLLGCATVIGRYALALALLFYGLAKVPPSQFGHLQSSQLAMSYGNSSPMGLLWRFMAFSTAYTVFAGLAELVPTALLLFRRTALLGSLLAFGVLLNVVMLNFCYDVPVKLYSINLLLLAVALVVPDLGRLIRFFVLNHPVQPANLLEPAFSSESANRTLQKLKVVVVGVVLTSAIFSSIRSYRRPDTGTTLPGYPLTTRGFHWIQEWPYNR